MLGLAILAFAVALGLGIAVAARSYLARGPQSDAEAERLRQSAEARYKSALVAAQASSGLVQEFGRYEGLFEALHNLIQTQPGSAPSSPNRTWEIAREWEGRVRGSSLTPLQEVWKALAQMATGHDWLIELGSPDGQAAWELARRWYDSLLALGLERDSRTRVPASRESARGYAIGGSTGNAGQARVVTASWTYRGLVVERGYAQVLEDS